MTRYFSPSTLGTYIDSIHMAIPADAVIISDALFAEVVTNRPAAKRLAPGPDGLPVLVDLPPPTEQQLIAEFTNTVQNWMDSSAQRFGYDDIGNAITYAEEPAVPKFQREGQAFRAWRSACWEFCYAQLAAVKSGERAMLTPQDLVAELPLLEFAND
ncbi:hypothetical protein J2Y86_005361 [Pseudomonas migulae]|uniref:hypothetical protein n=1 Tax=Pseudomonas migulae TaxID=78543 RepID=UPI00209C7FEB|nr:hypothetical protein [Pseudomonas migulae]MCP1500654.1 hypothetical protein [Pseudomonas migulae]